MCRAAAGVGGLLAWLVAALPPTSRRTAPAMGLQVPPRPACALPARAVCPSSATAAKLSSTTTSVTCIT